MLFFIIFIIFIILLLNEFYSRKKKHHTEFDRKIIHLLVGSFVAIWPFLITDDDIRFLSLSFLVVILISKKFNIFQSIHAVERPTIGEVFFALSVGIITFLTTNHYIYLMAILEMSLADGLAAVIGVHFGKSNRYKVLNQTKSIIGTMTFLIISITILFTFNLIGHVNQSDIYLLIVALILTACENLGVFGLDNLVVPIITVLFLK